MKGQGVNAIWRNKPGQQDKRSPSPTSHFPPPPPAYLRPGESSQSFNYGLGTTSTPVPVPPHHALAAIETHRQSPDLSESDTDHALRPLTSDDHSGWNRSQGQRGQTSDHLPQASPKGLNDRRLPPKGGDFLTSAMTLVASLLQRIRLCALETALRCRQGNLINESWKSIWGSLRDDPRSLSHKDRHSTAMSGTIAPLGGSPHSLGSRNHPISWTGCVRWLCRGVGVIVLLTFISLFLAHVLISDSSGSLIDGVRYVAPWFAANAHYRFPYPSYYTSASHTTSDGQHQIDSDLRVHFIGKRNSPLNIAVSPMVNLDGSPDSSDNPSHGSRVTKVLTQGITRLLGTEATDYPTSSSSLSSSSSSTGALQPTRLLPAPQIRFDDTDSGVSSVSSSSSSTNIFPLSSWPSLAVVPDHLLHICLRLGGIAAVGGLESWVQSLVTHVLNNKRMKIHAISFIQPHWGQNVYMSLRRLTELYQQFHVDMDDERMRLECDVIITSATHPPALSRPQSINTKLSHLHLSSITSPASSQPSSPAPLIVLGHTSSTEYHKTPSHYLSPYKFNPTSPHKVKSPTAKSSTAAKSSPNETGFTNIDKSLDPLVSPYTRLYNDALTYLDSIKDSSSTSSSSSSSSPMPQSPLSSIPVDNNNPLDRLVNQLVPFTHLSPSTRPVSILVIHGSSDDWTADYARYASAYDAVVCVSFGCADVYGDLVSSKLHLPFAVIPVAVNEKFIAASQSVNRHRVRRGLRLAWDVASTEDVQRSRSRPPVSTQGKRNTRITRRTRSTKASRIISKLRRAKRGNTPLTSSRSSNTISTSSSRQGSTDGDVDWLSVDDPIHQSNDPIGTQGTVSVTNPSSLRHVNSLHAGTKGNSLTESIQVVRTHVLCYLGRVQSDKNIDLLLKVAALMPPNWLTVIAGEDLFGTLPSHLPPNIRYLGNTRTPETLLTAVDAVFVPTLSEGGPVVLLEAWALNKPVFMYKTGIAVKHDDAVFVISKDMSPAHIASFIDQSVTSMQPDHQQLLKAKVSRGHHYLHAHYTHKAITPMFAHLIHTLRNGAPFSNMIAPLYRSKDANQGDTKVITTSSNHADHAEDTNQPSDDQGANWFPINNVQVNGQISAVTVPFSYFRYTTVSSTPTPPTPPVGDDPFDPAVDSTLDIVGHTRIKRLHVSPPLLSPDSPAITITAAPPANCLVKDNPQLISPICSGASRAHSSTSPSTSPSSSAISTSSFLSSLQPDRVRDPWPIPLLPRRPPPYSAPLSAYLPDRDDGRTLGSTNAPSTRDDGGSSGRIQDTIKSWFTSNWDSSDIARQADGNNQGNNQYKPVFHVRRRGKSVEVSCHAESMSPSDCVAHLPLERSVRTYLFPSTQLMDTPTKSSSKRSGQVGEVVVNDVDILTVTLHIDSLTAFDCVHGQFAGIVTLGLVSHGIPCGQKDIALTFPYGPQLLHQHHMTSQSASRMDDKLTFPSSKTDDAIQQDPSATPHLPYSWWTHARQNDDFHFKSMIPSRTFGWRHVSDLVNAQVLDQPKTQSSVMDNLLHFPGAVDLLNSIDIGRASITAFPGHDILISQIKYTIHPSYIQQLLNPKVSPSHTNHPLETRILSRALSPSTHVLHHSVICALTRRCTPSGHLLLPLN